MCQVVWHRTLRLMGFKEQGDSCTAGAYQSCWPVRTSSLQLANCIFPSRLSLSGRCLSRVMAKLHSELKLLPMVRSRVRQSSSRKFTSSTQCMDSMPSVAANRFAEAWANQVAAEEVIPHVVRLAARTSSQKIVQRRVGDILEKASTQLRRMDVRLNDHPQ